MTPQKQSTSAIASTNGKLVCTGAQAQAMSYLKAVQTNVWWQTDRISQEWVERYHALKRTQQVPAQARGA